MQKEDILFQLATHFLSRIALRIEYLLKIIQQASKESHEAIHRYALKNLVEIIEIIEKPELKSRFLKELSRIEYVLRKVNNSVDNQLILALADQIYWLNHIHGGFGCDLLQQPFLKAIRQIYQTNTHECEFNSPQLLMWLDRDLGQRQSEFISWLKMLRDLEQTVQIYLSLLRTTSCFTSITAHNGFYQYSLSPKITCHLIQLKIDKNLSLVPKLQTGHHGLNIRLYELLSLKELNNCSIDMEMAICQL